MVASVTTTTGLSPDFIDDLTATMSQADAGTLRGMLPAIYDELHRVAVGLFHDERPEHTLQPTALVHEAYLRMADQRQARWQNRAQLLGIFARMMRRVLLDHAGARLAAKRGGKNAVRITLDEALDVYQESQLNLFEVEEALRRLEKLDPVQAKIVELRFFGGLNVEEVADALDISSRTVKREWSVAKRWLQRELSSAE